MSTLYQDADGLDSIDCTGVQIGNAGIPCERGTPSAQPETPPQAWPLQDSAPWGWERVQGVAP